MARQSDFRSPLSAVCLPSLVSSDLGVGRLDSQCASVSADGLYLQYVIVTHQKRDLA